MAIETFTPTLTPLEAFQKLCDIGKFSCEGYLYEMEVNDLSACAENLATGDLWFSSGKFGEAVNEATEWLLSPPINLQQDEM